MIKCNECYEERTADGGEKSTSIPRPSLLIMPHLRVISRPNKVGFAVKSIKRMPANFWSALAFLYFCSSLARSDSVSVRCVENETDMKCATKNVRRRISRKSKYTWVKINRQKRRGNSGFPCLVNGKRTQCKLASAPPLLSTLLPCERPLSAGAYPRSLPVLLRPIRPASKHLATPTFPEQTSNLDTLWSPLGYVIHQRLFSFIPHAPETWPSFHIE